MPVPAAIEMEPLPVPDPPELIVSQGALLVAVHPQPAPAVTVIEDGPPAKGMEIAAGAAANVQDELNVVNEKIAEPVLPAVFFADTCQK